VGRAGGGYRVLWCIAALAIWTSRLAGLQDTTRSHPRLFPVRVDHLYGYIDATGSIVIAPRFDEVARVFSEGLARVCLGFGP
jgi:hypothetical protein